MDRSLGDPRRRPRSLGFRAVRPGSRGWCAPGGVGHSGSMQLASGMLLVATPALLDPNFADTVVLLLDVDDDGALGVVLNRPSRSRSPRSSSRGATWSPSRRCSSAAARSAPTARSPSARCATPATRRSASARSPALLGHGRPRHPDRAGRRHARPACGSSPGTPAGAPSQLDGEIEEGSWYVVTGEAADVFRDDPERPVARRAAPPARRARLARPPARSIPT